MLLTVLVGVLMISALAAVLQGRTAAVISVFGRVEDAHRVTLAELSVNARVRSLWRHAGPGQPADGRAVIMQQDGWNWETRVTDVEGLVDLYVSPDEVFGILPDQNAEDTAERRSAAIELLPVGSRWLTETQTLAQFGFNAAEREQLAPLVTQRARTGAINPDLAPEELVQGALGISQQDIAGGELAEITIRRLR